MVLSAQAAQELRDQPGHLPAAERRVRQLQAVLQDPVAGLSNGHHLWKGTEHAASRRYTSFEIDATVYNRLKIPSK